MKMNREDMERIRREKRDFIDGEKKPYLCPCGGTKLKSGHGFVCAVTDCPFEAERPAALRSREVVVKRRKPVRTSGDLFGALQVSARMGRPHSGSAGRPW